MKDKVTCSPPKLAQWLMRRLFPDNGAYSTLGDMEEVFQQICEVDGYPTASLFYWRQVFKAIPPKTGDVFYWRTVMFFNFLKIGLRNLRKNALFSVFNILGLSIAVGCCLLVFLFTDFFTHMDTFHEHRDRVFLITNIIERDGVEKRWGDSPAPLGPAMVQEIPQVKRAVRIDAQPCIVEVEGQKFNESVHLVDPHFLDIFTFPLVQGDASVLQQNNSIIITEELASKFFGDESALDQVVTVMLNSHEEDFIVSGIAENRPKNASFGFNALIPLNRRIDFGYPNLHEWDQGVWCTFIQTEKPEDIDIVYTHMVRYKKIQNQADHEWPMKEFIFQPLKTLAQNSHKILWCISGGIDPAVIYLLSLCAFFILTLASSNYINISMVSAVKRFREIGIRKVLGSGRWLLIRQFMGEHLAICALAILLGIFFTDAVFIPLFDGQFGMPPYNLNPLENPRIWLFITGMLLVTVFFAGAYPSFFVSKFRPVTIFRKQRIRGSRKGFSRGLLVLQFFLTFVLIATSIAYYNNGRYLRTIDWGYNQENVIVVPISAEISYERIHNAFEHHPGIIQIAGSTHHISHFESVEVLDVTGREEKVEYRRFDCGAGYFETMGVRIKEGRFFNESLRSDFDETIMINEIVMDRLGWKTIEGKQMRLGQENHWRRVVGVTKTFQHRIPSNENIPLVFLLASREKYQYFVARLKSGSSVQVRDDLEKFWKENVNNESFYGFFQDETFDWVYNQQNNFSRFYGFLALIALIISCMGLFGLVATTITIQIKELSIRKVLGATTAQLSKGIQKRFLILLSIVTALATPICLLGLKLFLKSQFKNYQPPNVLVVFVPSLIIFIAAQATAAGLVSKAARTNPVEHLRNE